MADAEAMDRMQGPVQAERSSRLPHSSWTRGWSDPLGLPWKFALVLLLLAPCPVLILPASQAWPLALGVTGLAALLALLAGPLALARSMTAPEADSDLPQVLRQVLEDQRRGLEEAAGLVSRAVTAGAQLSRLAQAAEQRLKAGLEVPAAPPPAQTGMAPELRQWLDRNPGPRLEAALDRLEALAASQPETRLLAEHLDGCITRLEGLMQDRAAPGEWTVIRQQLAELMLRTNRGEASLGDAARYLTETTDRLTEGVGGLELALLRLQALLSIGGQRAQDTVPLQEALAALERQIAAASRLGDALDHSQRHMLEALAASAEVAACRPAPLPPESEAGQLLDSLQDRGQAVSPQMLLALRRLSRVEGAAAQALEEAQALAETTIPPASLEEHAPVLRRAIEGSIRRLGAAARALNQAGT